MPPGRAGERRRSHLNGGDARTSARFEGGARPLGGGGPFCVVRPALCARSSCSCARGNHGRACGGGCGAEKCVSRRRCSRLCARRTLAAGRRNKTTKYSGAARTASTATDPPNGFLRTVPKLSTPVGKAVDSMLGKRPQKHTARGLLRTETHSEVGGEDTGKAPFSGLFSDLLRLWISA
jgi:hypothetical protein